jgi:hypothetical protein
VACRAGYETLIVLPSIPRPLSELSDRSPRLGQEDLGLGEHREVRPATTRHFAAWFDIPVQFEDKAGLIAQTRPFSTVECFMARSQKSLQDLQEAIKRSGDCTGILSPALTSTTYYYLREA